MATLEARVFQAGESASARIIFTNGISNPCPNGALVSAISPGPDPNREWLASAKNEAIRSLRQRGPSARDQRFDPRRQREIGWGFQRVAQPRFVQDQIEGLWPVRSLD